MQPSAEMQRAARQGGPGRKDNSNSTDDSNATETEQGENETALGAALREALARKAVAR